MLITNVSFGAMEDMSFFSHRRMVKYRESIIFVDVFCLEHDLDAL